MIYIAARRWMSMQALRLDRVQSARFHPGMQVKGPTGLLSHQRNRIIPQKAQVVIVGIATLDRDVFITQKMWIIN